MEDLLESALDTVKKDPEGAVRYVEMSEEGVRLWLIYQYISIIFINISMYLNKYCALVY